MITLNKISNAFHKIFHKRPLKHPEVTVIVTAEEKFEKVLEVGKSGIVALISCSNELLNYHFREICRYNNPVMAL